MNKEDINYKVYLVTDRNVLKGRNLCQAIEESIKGGAGIVQLREKNISSLEFFNIAKEVKTITDKYDVPLIINDRLDIAMAVKASGVHLGQEDIPCSIAREILGKDMIIGVSAHNLEEALKAEKDGADYIGCGAVFSTTTKKDTVRVSIDDIKKIKESINIKMVAIGGIDQVNIKKLNKTGIDGVAVVSSVLGRENIKEATEELFNNNF
ncbi:thiamine-phosphate diphosphorylase [Clostridium sp. DSM 8431]|uniref:thiamine phosphate synthase n=1 Tax=Clostridium sp. DSM 8431 TaxID=1761781 RepID=UPI0008F37DD0|nr:thiamine phosphate synthase [Clostridium sp. DSM 8431]SFU50617.1 thiamine-phosphate diphosphorylase [Clostridium sp. DSM 8431]